MPTPEVKRYEVIKPVASGTDEYGNLSVTTSTGTELKVNKKHESLHELIVGAVSTGRAVKIGYAVYMNKEYVHTAELYDGMPAEAPKPTAYATKIPPAIAPQELGMWWKELGECLRAGYVKSDVLRKFYLAKMYSVIGFEPGTPKPKSPEEYEPDEIPY